MTDENINLGEFELTIWQRYPQFLNGVLRQGHIARRMEEFFALLKEINDPLVILSSLSLMIRNRLDGNEWDLSMTGDLFYASPNSFSFDGYNDFNPDIKMLDLVWGELEEIASMIIRYYREIPCIKKVLGAACEMSQIFWESATGDASLRKVLRGIFLAGIGQDLSLLDFGMISTIALSRDPATDIECDAHDILFLKMRVDLVLSWLEENLTVEQIVSFPSLIRFVAGVSVLGYSGNTVFCTVSTQKVLKADLEIGLRALCQAAVIYDDSEFIGDAFGEVLETSSDERILKEISRDVTCPECQKMAVEILNSCGKE